MKDRPLLVRFRPKDSREGVTRETMRKIAGALDLSETEAVHRALVEYANRFVPRYAADDGPLSNTQHVAIAKLVRKKHGKATVVESLFEDSPAAPRSRASRRLPSSRSR